MRVACVDIGTNSVLLLVAERGPGGEVVAVAERATITRLGQGVDASGELHPEARERTLCCLRGYAGEARALGVERVVAVGTSAMRDARGGAEFAREAAAVLGEAPRVISGDEEARLTFRGALAGLSVAPGPLVVCDVGGGSTEVITGALTPHGISIDHAVSLNTGSVRLTERCLRSDPPGAGEVAALDAEIARQLSALAPPPVGARLVGVAGTVTTLAAVARRMAPYDGARMHGLVLGSNEVSATAAELLSVPVEMRQQMAGMEPKRADVVAAGARLVAGLVAWAGVSELTVSDRGVRWGLALEALG